MKRENINRLYKIVKGELSFDKKQIGLKPKLLLHSCCGPCSTSVIEKLSEDFEVTVFFFNPNITEKDEYEKRRENQVKALRYFNKKFGRNIQMLDETYNSDEFFKVAKGYEESKEGGARCSKCFFLRLKETANEGKKNGFEIFGTTLTVSPHKNYNKISAIGKNISRKLDIFYLDGNFKKKDGYKRSIEISENLGLYRQNYCGCVYSKWMDNK